MKKYNKDQKEEYPFSLFLKFAMWIVGIWFLSGLMLFFIPDRGTFGDMFGSINALFSGVALAGIIFTILQQNKKKS